MLMSCWKKQHIYFSDWVQDWVEFFSKRSRCEKRHHPIIKAVRNRGQMPTVNLNCVQYQLCCTSSDPHSLYPKHMQCSVRTFSLTCFPMFLSQTCAMTSEESFEPSIAHFAFQECHKLDSLLLSCQTPPCYIQITKSINGANAVNNDYLQ